MRGLVSIKEILREGNFKLCYLDNTRNISVQFDLNKLFIPKKIFIFIARLTKTKYLQKIQVDTDHLISS